MRRAEGTGSTSRRDRQRLEILRVFNNNVILARRGDQGEIVVTGRGIGFGAKPGTPADRSRVRQIFVPEDPGHADAFAAKVAALSPEYLALAEKALAEVQQDSESSVNSTTVVALADHLSFALERLARGLELGYPLRAEVVHLYPDEFAQAQQVLAFLNGHLDRTLPTAEAVPITLHLVNAGFATGDLSATYRMTAVIPQLFEVLESTYGWGIDRESVDAARFIAHLRYFFVRVYTGRQFVESPASLGSAVKESYPEAYRAAQKVRTVLELKLEHRVNEDEVTYLTLHIARMTDGLRG